MKEPSDHIQVQINGEHNFFLNRKIMSRYSWKLKKMIKQACKNTLSQNAALEMRDFPGGVEGFELVSRFCYNNGAIRITPWNVPTLYCSAKFLEMTEKALPCNLIQKTEAFLEGLYYWSWRDIMTSLKSCECFFSSADSYGLVDKLISALLSKMGRDFNLTTSSSSSPSSSETPDSAMTCRPSSPAKAWWFDDLTNLSPKTVEKIIKTIGCYGTRNNSVIFTKFLIHYLKRGGTGFKSKVCSEYSGLADTAVHGVVRMGIAGFSCRGLFWVLRVVSGFGLSKECRIELEKMIGEVLEKATLDDLLVSGQGECVGAYDVNLVLRLVRVCVGGEVVAVQKIKKVGRLIDKYMGEISPDQSLKVSKFLAVAESLPDYARDCFDGVYRAIDIYLESHSTLSFEERLTLCRCLNYEKLTLAACKDLAKNPRIPPRVAVRALASRQPNLQSKAISPQCYSQCTSHMTSSPEALGIDDECCEKKDEMKMNLERMQSRVMELEKVCMDMNNQMSVMVKSKAVRNTFQNRAFPKLC